MGTVLRGGRLVDGTKAPARDADVRIEGDTIAAVGEVAAEPGDEVIDLRGLTLAPGFIDVHTHFDAQLFWDGDLTPSSWHGVTTAVQTNCGFGLAPTRPEDRQRIMETLENVEGMNVDTLTEGIPWTWETFPEYIDAVRRQPLRINLGMYVGHTAVRSYVLGAVEAAEREATPDEIARMAAIVREAMDAGAIGFSTSLADSHVGFEGRPVPSRLASREELGALLTAMGESGRGIAEVTYGPPFTLEETAALSRDLGVRITWGALLTGLFGGHGAALEMLDAASAVGGNLWPQVSCREIVFQMTLEDPYYFGRAPLFQSRVLSVPRSQRAAVYADREWREAVLPQVLSIRPGWFDKISIQETQKHPSLIGRSIADIAAERGTEPFDLLLDLALEEDLKTRFRVVSLNDDEEELGALLADHRIVLGAHDAGAHVNMLCDANFPTHLLAYWVREQGVLGLEEAIWRLTGQPAELFRLEDRGTVAKGKRADLVAFDADTVSSQPLERRYDFPAGGDRLVAESTGIEHVWVNGQPIRTDGRNLEGVSPGRVLS